MTGRATLGLTIGTNVQAFDATLAALAAYNTDGILAQTAADTFVGRTLTGTTNEISVANGNGVSGNPTFSLPSTIALAGKTVSGGTFSAPAISGGSWSGGTDIAVADGGTGASDSGTARTNLGAAPANAAYIVSTLNSELSAENVLTAGNGISISTATVSCDFATQAEMETATSTTDVVSPGRVQNHPGVAKAWAYVAGDGTITASHNITTSNCRTGLGTYTITITTDFSSANYAIIFQLMLGSGFIYTTAQAAGSFSVNIRNSLDSANVDLNWSFVAYGDQ